MVSYADGSAQHTCSPSMPHAIGLATPHRQHRPCGLGRYYHLVANVRGIYKECTHSITGSPRHQALLLLEEDTTLLYQSLVPQAFKSWLTLYDQRDRGRPRPVVHILDWLVPCSARETHSFLGLVGYIVEP